MLMIFAGEGGVDGEGGVNERRREDVLETIRNETKKNTRQELEDHKKHDLIPRTRYFLTVLSRWFCSKKRKADSSAKDPCRIFFFVFLLIIGLIFSIKLVFQQKRYFQYISINIYLYLSLIHI